VTFADALPEIHSILERHFDDASGALGTRGIPARYRILVSLDVSILDRA
jgi:hypothetical protein